MFRWGGNLSDEMPRDPCERTVAGSPGYQLFDRIMIRRSSMAAKRLHRGHRGRRSARHAALATLEIVKEPVSLADHRLQVNRKDTCGASAQALHSRPAFMYGSEAKLTSIRFKACPM